MTDDTNLHAIIDRLNEHIALLEGTLESRNRNIETLREENVRLQADIKQMACDVCAIQEVHSQQKARLYAERDAYKADAELWRVAIKFVDRAGDVHPGIDDAETICADFYKAMSAAIDAAMKPKE